MKKLYNKDQRKNLININMLINKIIKIFNGKC